MEVGVARRSGLARDELGPSDAASQDELLSRGGPTGVGDAFAGQVDNDIGTLECGPVEGAGRGIPVELLSIGRRSSDEPAHGVALRGEVGGERLAEPA